MDTNEYKSLIYFFFFFVSTIKNIKFLKACFVSAFECLPLVYMLPHKLTHFVIDCCVIFILDLLNVILCFVCASVCLIGYILHIFFIINVQRLMCVWRVYRSGCDILYWVSCFGFCDYETKDAAVASLYGRWTTFLISVWQLHVNVHDFRFFFMANH